MTPRKSKNRIGPKNPNRPFKGPTRKNFQTVHLSHESTARLLNSSARRKAVAARFPRKQYAIVDASRTIRARDVPFSNVDLYSHGIQKFIETCLKNGTKARHLTFVGGERLPFTPTEQESWLKLFTHFHQLVIPNGKLYFTTSNDSFFAYVHSLAVREKLKIRENSSNGKHSMIVTLGLKKLYPDKKERIKKS